MFELTKMDSIRISLASPDTIRKWSHGEVEKAETINYRTLKPERDGLFCEKIFGPTKDWECNCGKYKRVRFKGVVCDKCGVEVTKAKVRRERMGHIELAAPVSHIWYFKGIPSRMGTLLNISPRNLEQVLYFASYIVLDPGDPNVTKLNKHQLLSETEYQNLKQEAKEVGFDFRVGMGAEAVREMLQEVDLEALNTELRAELEELSTKGAKRESESQKRQRLIKRLEVVESFRQSGNKPEWMVLDVVPVIPPELRPMVQLDGGRFATADLNDLYRRVINRNNRLKRMLEMGAPDIIVRNEKRMLQEAVDALIDNGRRGRPVTGAAGRQLKSLSDLLRGKQGRFRQNLLGKRVDYSGRSVIVVGPSLKLYQCGLPKEMALELFKPFVIEKLCSRGMAANVKAAKRKVEQIKPEVWDVLEDVIKNHPVMLNRAPTLHRLGIQAFEPILVEGKALKLHPLCCTAFNADFDGDQMAVHVPLSMEAQAEARFLMLAANNILKPQDGKPVICPTQDMVLGCYYLTMIHEGLTGTGRVFADVDEARRAFDTGELHLEAPCKIRMTRTFEGKEYTRMVDTTIGRVIFNRAIPQDIGMQKRETLDDMFKFEIDEVVGKKQLGKIVDNCYRAHGVHITSKMLDDIKALGYKYSTRAALTVSIADIQVPPQKKDILAEAEDRVHKIEKLYKRGMMSENERYSNVIRIWEGATNDVTKQVLATLEKFNPINMMADSGARGSINQIRQLSGMRGLMASPTGKIIELPIKSNFREGLSVLEFFLSSHGSRKSLADTAMKTADSGYMTRRLVDVSQENIIREIDCFANRHEKVRGMKVQDIGVPGDIIEGVEDRIRGRVSAEDVIDPTTGEVIIECNELITHDIAKRIVGAGITEVSVRSVLTCCSGVGVCAKCYGANMTDGKLVDVGEAVGIIAAQSIGEPGTQLTMRTFHTGGVATGEDITQGLPRVEELFEARRPKREAVLAEIGGTLHITIDSKKRKKLVIQSNDGDAETKEYPISYNAKLRFEEGDTVKAGDELVDGSINPHDLLRILGVKAVQDYLVKEVQSVYRRQGVEIADKHIEVIVRQMLRKVQIEDANDTDLLPGAMVDIFRFDQENRKAIEAGKQPATAKRKLLGITKAALATESFLSAASFQETTRVLTEAAIKGKVDPLLGLKENVIIGKQIPAGTGLARYADIEIHEAY
ncbi:MAG: DNA-directed RNA polymerase subunit beta' [Clostridia bacterium]|nr:DNA-directed RNA polymerase subunit beta' [Clostridia bacterium]